MPGLQNIPLTGAVQLASLAQTALAASKLRLTSAAFTPTPADTVAELELIEADYSGYTAGGAELTTWLAPIHNQAGGASTTSAQVQFAYVPPEGTGVPNTITGWFLLDATGDLIADGTINPNIGLAQAGDGFTMTVTLVFGTTNLIVSVSVNGSPG